MPRHNSDLRLSVPLLELGAQKRPSPFGFLSGLPTDASMEVG